MLRLLIIAQKNEAIIKLGKRLKQKGVACSTTSYTEVADAISFQSPDVILVEISNNPLESGVWADIQRVKPKKQIPLIALVPGEILGDMNGQLNAADDFITSPYDETELELRATRLLYRTKKADSGEIIECDNLMIDLAKYEVTLGGKVIELTFKEYELLKFLASNKGRVYTREALLNRIWGYDYYGGDRTVDVHIRRLRSKIEDAKYNFIETVRNIGYKFRKDC